MTFEELLAIDKMSKAIVYVGNTKYNRRIENLYLADDSAFINRVSRGELVLLSDAVYAGMEENLSAVIEKLAAKNAAGLLLATGEHLTEPDEKAIASGNAAGFPLITIPFEGSLSKVVASIYYAIFRSREKVKKADVFMRELLFGDEETALSYLPQYNYVGSRQHIVMYLGLDQSGSDIALLEEVARAVPANLSLQLFSVYYMDTEGVIVVLELSQREPLEHVVMRILNAVHNSLQEVLHGKSVSAGVSSIFYEPERMRACIDEAKRAFEVQRGCGIKHSARYFEEIGVYRFFYEFGNDIELKDFVMEILGELIQYDEENNSDYVNTLQVYLEEGKNIGETAQKLYVHRNTIKYRITKVEEILNIDLEDTNTVFNLQFAFKIRKYLVGKAHPFVDDRQK